MITKLSEGWINEGANEYIVIDGWMGGGLTNG